MGSRERELLNLLADGGFYPADKIAQKLDTGTKTVRNLIKKMNEELPPHGASIHCKYGTGYHLDLQDPVAYAQYYRRHYESIPESYLPSTSAERVQYLLEYLCNSVDYVKLDDLSETLYVSKRTLTSDIKEVERILESYNIKLKRKPHYGIRIEGNEFDLRLCIAACAGKRLNKGNQSMDKIARCVSTVLAENNFALSGATYQNLVVHLYIAISRMSDGHPIPLPETQLTEIHRRPEYEVAQKLAQMIENTFSISFPQTEVAYIAIHLAGKELILPGGGDPESNIVISQEISDLVDRMLNRVYESFKLDLREDLELRMILSQHLLPLRVRIEYDMRLKNPLLSDVKKKFCLAYTLACSAVTVINEQYHTALSEDEVAYFAFAFALSLERKKTGIQKKNILLVCASGRGSAMLLKYKYESAFSGYIDRIDACDVGHLYSIDFSQYDYIFTTVPIPVKVPIPIQEVGYFLNEDDRSNLKKVLTAEPFVSIERYYPSDLFLPHLKCATKAEALYQMCQFVIEKRQLPPEFYDSVLERESLAQTVFGSNFAMPHSYKAMGRETAVCVGILDEPIDWDGQGVQVIFLVVIADQDHASIELQQFYQTTVNFLLNPQQIQNLIKNQDYPQFLQALSDIDAHSREETE